MKNCVSGNAKIVNLLIKHGANVDQTDLKQKTPLHWAIRNANIVNLLIENGADVDSIDDEEKSALYKSVEGGNFFRLN